MIVGKLAIIIGLCNSTFQEITYNANINPKRKVSELDASEKRTLYECKVENVNERIRLGGEDHFTDLFGKSGRMYKR